MGMDRGRTESGFGANRLQQKMLGAPAFGYLVYDALDEDYLDVDVAGDVGDELGDEVVGGGEGEAGGVALGAGGEAGGAAGDVEVADLVVDGEADQVGVVHHAFAVVALGPDDLEDGVADAVLDRLVRLAVVVRVLVDDGWDQKGAEEFAGDVLGVGDADALAEAGEAGAVGGVGVGGDADAGGGKDGDAVEGIDDVADGEPGFFFGGERLDLGAVEKARVPVNHGYVDGAWDRHEDGLVGKRRGDGSEAGDGVGFRDGRRSHDAAFVAHLTGACRGQTRDMYRMIGRGRIGKRVAILRCRCESGCKREDGDRKTEAGSREAFRSGLVWRFYQMSGP